MKICSKCEIELPFEEFHKDSTKPDGLRTTCKSCKKLSDQSYAKRNAEKIAVGRRKRYLKNYEKERKQQQEYARNNKDLLRVHHKKYRKNNKGKVNAATRKRQADKLNATPVWANLEQIKRIYTACALVSKRTGVEHHVDHIIPLRGENVCGLHVENNLAIIPAKMNLEKGNKYDAWSDPIMGY